MANTPPPPQPAPNPDQGANSGGVTRDVTDILANLDPEQLAAIVAVARGASHQNGGEAESMMAAALPPGLEGQAASALTSLTASGKREKTEGHDRVANGEAGNDTRDATDADLGGESTRYLAEETTHHDGGDYTDHDATAAAIAAMESLAGTTQDGSSRQGKGRAKRDTGPEAERNRKDQHKEVERKRREQISNGITDLASIVPGCDSKGINKTAIITAAVRYIMELKNNEASNIEKWTLEKLLMDQALADREADNARLRSLNGQYRVQLGLPEEDPEEEQRRQEHAQHVQDQVAVQSAINAASAKDEPSAIAAAVAENIEEQTKASEDAALAEDHKAGRRRGAAAVESADASARSKRSRNA